MCLEKKSKKAVENERKIYSAQMIPIGSGDGTELEYWGSRIRKGDEGDVDIKEKVECLRKKSDRP